MFNIILYQPEIPGNTGNIIRLCANTGASLHLIKPLGFILDDKRLKRAGLDYHEWAKIMEYENIADCFSVLKTPKERIFAFTSKGKRAYSDVAYQAGDAFLFGPETRGLPADILNALPDEQKIVLPQMPVTRSLNLSNTVAIAVYEAWRQRGFRAL